MTEAPSPLGHESTHSMCAGALAALLSLGQNRSVARHIVHVTVYTNPSDSRPTQCNNRYLYREDVIIACFCKTGRGCHPCPAVTVCQMINGMEPIALRQSVQSIQLKTRLATGPNYDFFDTESLPRANHLPTTMRHCLINLQNSSDRSPWQFPCPSSLRSWRFSRRISCKRTTPVSLRQSTTTRSQMAM